MYMCKSPLLSVKMQNYFYMSNAAVLSGYYGVNDTTI